ncbi:MAG TPA: hypothetical protein VHU82_13480 [Vicinamibacterales bacterium]|nr:hypothetical protein [Vicinamibacterales bacterium]
MQINRFTESDALAEESLYWQRVGSIPDCALSPDGVPTPNTIYDKLI